MTDLLQIIENVVGFLDEFELLFGVICFVLGVIFAIRGLMGAAKRQEMGAGQGSWGGPLMMFTTGVLFVAMPGLVNSLSQTFFALSSPSSPENIFSYAPATIGIMDGAEARTIIVGITAIVQFIGLIAIARGLYLMNMSAQSAQGPKTFGPGLTFVIAGALATNFPTFVGVMENLITAAPAVTGPVMGVQ
jgi:hypothetical protein